MPIYLNTTGRTPLSVGLCARCGIKYALADLEPDPNSPGLYVCREDRDVLDPYRLAPPPADRIAIEHARPDFPLVNGPVQNFANVFDGLTQYPQPNPWYARMMYLKGATITPLDVNADTTTLPQNWFVALNNGMSGVSAPAWPPESGQTIMDGTIQWLSLGIYLN